MNKILPDKSVVVFVVVEKISGNKDHSPSSVELSSFATILN